MGFGAGAGTEALVNLLIRQEIPFEYVSYENDPSYLPTHLRVHAVLWKKTPEALVPGPYDLILMDGPKGAETMTRMRWFPLLPPVIRKGTVFLVDDFGANPNYGVELQKRFEYTEIADRPRTSVGVDNWRVVRIEGVKE